MCRRCHRSRRRQRRRQRVVSAVTTPTTSSVSTPTVSAVNAGDVATGAMPTACRRRGERRSSAVCRRGGAKTWRRRCVGAEGVDGASTRRRPVSEEAHPRPVKRERCAITLANVPSGGRTPLPSVKGLRTPPSWRGVLRNVPCATFLPVLVPRLRNR